ncbi:2-(1,2-epoxy-1,2-dihydrophenyl)acetyl-CoA isomerase PaaG [Marinomonas sp. TI.3.20]|uniref:2-(1,2-epoxy-1,2-dihydrophenyl)acetyl-CoA isomerase PaaG n=1 Tax=Marinomonas sp. TI.3.20 TaxID=3121296 RepID=UPI00311E2252
MSFEHILYSVTSGVALLSLNRPKSLNSFNEAMHLEVREAFKLIKNDKQVRALVLTGEGRGFCAGQDLSDRNVDPNAESPDLGRSIEKFYNPLIKAIQDLPMPVICAVNGVAAGAGANIPLACDLIMAGRSAKFIQAFCKIGLVPDSGGTWFLPRLVGMAKAKELALLGEAVTAEAALDMGLINRVVEDDSLRQEALDLAQKLATQPTQGLAYIKRALNQTFDHGLHEHLLLERDLQRLAGQTQDYREGVAAFMAKRAPEFKGE